MRKVILTTLLLLFILCFSAYSFKLPDTGQTQSYTDTFGEDSDYTINPPSYIKLDSIGNALPDSATEWTMVKDNVTELIWEVKIDLYKNNRYTWDEANDYVQTLNVTNFGGYSDWRLPTVKELESITDSGRYDPTIKISYFPNTKSHFYHSSTTSAYDTNYVWGIYFHAGVLVRYNKFKMLDTYYVRAVRSEQVDNPVLVDNGDGTITDTNTGLMWQKQDSDSAMGWESAIEYCQNLSFAGYTDWRLPTKRELLSIVDYTQYSPAIDISYFQDTKSLEYWTSTTYAVSTYIHVLGIGGFEYDVDGRDYKYYVNFSFGDVGNSIESNAYYVRAVRSGYDGIIDMSILPDTIELTYPGDTVQPLVQVLYSEGIWETQENQNITWISSDESVASVESGLIVAKEEGQAVITATKDGASSQIYVTVLYDIISIDLYQNILFLKTGDTYTPVVTANYEDGTSDTITDFTITYSNGAENIVAIQDNQITAIKDGVAHLEINKGALTTSLHIITY